jgi:hypothetical protein
MSQHQGFQALQIVRGIWGWEGGPVAFTVGSPAWAHCEHNRQYSIQRLAFGLSRLILQLIASSTSKNEKNVAPRFLLQKNHILKTRDFFCQRQNRPDFERKSIKKTGKNTKWQKSSAIIKRKTLYFTCAN